MVTKRLLRVLAGEAVWPPPVWLMRQAGRYLPEYRALRAQAGDFLGLCTSPKLAAEVTLQPIRRFAMDGAILFSDLPIVSWALGQDLRYVEGEGPVMTPIRDVAGLAALRLERVAGAVAPILETVRLVRAELDEAALIGFSGGVFTMACYMVEGHGSREFAETRGLAYRDPALFGMLVDLLVEANLVYLRGQADAGAEALMLFDSWAGLLPPAEFSRWVTAPTARIVAGLRESHPGVPVIGFPRLAGVGFGAYAAGSGVAAVAMDTAMDPLLAAAMVPATTALQGNLDPLAVVAGGAAMEVGIDGLLAAMRGRPFVFNLGHGLVPQTPPAHVEALVTRVRAG
jgi:uroporphyrinogen decarboxylase